MRALIAPFALLPFALAIPPACLLGALNNDQQNLADISTICSSNAADVQGNISSMCGDMTDEALSYFADTCKQVANVSVGSATSSATRTGTTTSGGSRITGQSSTDVVGEPTPTGGASTSPSGSAQSRGAAVTNGAGSFAAVAIAAVGVIAAA